MATEPVVRAAERAVEIPEDLRSLLDLRETPTHYMLRTLSGATLIRLKSTIRHPWDLLSGIMDDGKDTTEERGLEREREWSHDERTLGGHGAE